jgi:hypothetical protein
VRSTCANCEPAIWKARQIIEIGADDSLRQLKFEEYA